MAKKFSGIFDQIFVNELRHQLIAKIATDWNEEWAKEHREWFSSIEDLSSKNAFYRDLEQKIYFFLAEKFKREGSDIQYVSRHTLPRFLDENHQKGFEIETTLNPIAQYCGYDNWEEFNTLNPETISGQFFKKWRISQSNYHY